MHRLGNLEYTDRLKFLNTRRLEDLVYLETEQS